MKVLYYCHNCGDFIDELTVDRVDEEKLGFNVLTQEEKEDIMKWSDSGNMLYVGSVCDHCYHEFNNMQGGEMEPYYDDEGLNLYSSYDYPRMH